jgi:hypothetical protein
LASAASPGGPIDQVREHADDRRDVRRPGDGRGVRRLCLNLDTESATIEEIEAGYDEYILQKDM